MKLRAKSTTLSHRAPVYYVDLTIREGMTLEAAITEARALSEQRKAVGHDQVALDQAARVGFENGAFEETEEEIPDVLEEFYPEAGDGVVSGQTVIPIPTKLTSKLGRNDQAAA
jgi:hypothetical protein